MPTATKCGGCDEASPVSVLPIISLYQYLKSLRNPHGLTRTLPPFRMIGYRTGNSAAAFEIEFAGGRRAMLKCYTRPRQGLREIYGRRLLEKELYVYIDCTRGVWVDVVVTDWVAGATLGEAVRQAVAAHDRDTLRRISAAFDRLALGMLADGRAHGDLKPDNIIVAPGPRLRLIDFDAAYLPSMYGRESPELGTADWQHPSRRKCDFNRHIDDYPIAMLSTVLHALAAEPAIFGRIDDDCLPFTSQQAVAGRSEALCRAERLFAERCMPAEFRTAQLLRSGSYILPRLEEFMSYCASAPRPLPSGTVPELDYRCGLWGYGTAGRFVIPPLFDSGFEFRDGTAEVTLGGTTHRIDTTGRPAATGLSAAEACSEACTIY